MLFIVFLVFVFSEALLFLSFYFWKCLLFPYGITFLSCYRWYYSYRYNIMYLSAHSSNDCYLCLAFSFIL